MTKTEAIRQSAQHVFIHGSRTSWTVVGPHHSDDPSGPSGEFHTDSYEKARRIATGWRALIALSLMDKLDDESESAVDCENYDHYGDHTLRGLVAKGIAAYGTGPTPEQRRAAADEYWATQK
jgi:hypothetical protein